MRTREQHAGAHLVLRQQRQVQQDFDGLGVRRHDDELSDAAVERLGGCVVIAAGVGVGVAVVCRCVEGAAGCKVRMRLRACTRDAQVDARTHTRPHPRWPPSSAACSWRSAARCPGWCWTAGRRPGGTPSGSQRARSSRLPADHYPEGLCALGACGSLLLVLSLLISVCLGGAPPPLCHTEGSVCRHSKTHLDARPCLLNRNGQLPRCCAPAQRKEARQAHGRGWECGVRAGRGGRPDGHLLPAASGWGGPGWAG